LSFIISCDEPDDEKEEFGSGLNLSTPYVNEADIESINEAFSLHDGAPWGFKHVGIDFFTGKTLKQFSSSCDGEVTKVELWQNGEKWQVNIIIECDKEFMLVYSFEPFTKNETVGQTQLSQITVKAGDTIAKNDVIGALVISENSGHVHFSLKQNNEFICPKKYFTEKAYLSIMRIIHKTHSEWEMCY
jgi:hypothetical protein